MRARCCTVCVVWVAHGDVFAAAYYCPAMTFYFYFCVEFLALHCSELKGMMPGEMSLLWRAKVHKRSARKLGSQ